MALIDLMNPNDSSMRGGLRNPDPVLWSAVLGGSPVNLGVCSTWSMLDEKFTAGSRPFCLEPNASLAQSRT
jgi:hypothetical protein